MGEPRSRGPAGSALASGLGILLVAVNLRAAIVAVSPLLDEIRLDTGMSEALGGFLTTLPVLCFGVFAPAVPRLTRRFGMEGTVLVAMAVLAAGTLLRLFDPVLALFAGTAAIGIGICAGNVVLPALIKRDHHDRIGPMTGAYTTALSMGATVAAALTVPLQDALGLSWRQTIAIWSLPALASALIWVRRWRSRRRSALPSAPLTVIRGLYRDRLAWRVTLFMGMQSTIYYSTIAWLPTLFTDGGLSSGQAGYLLGLTNLIGLPASLIVPIMAGRRGEQRDLILAITALTGIGLLGIVFAPQAAPAVWMIMLGLGQGASVGLAFTLVSLRAPDSSHASQLSSMSQAVGYTFAAIGPVAMGAAFQLTGSWTVAFGLTLIALAVQHVTGMEAARSGLIGSRAADQPIVTSSVGNDGEINS